MLKEIDDLPIVYLDSIDDGYGIVGFGFECEVCGGFSFVSGEEEIFCCESCNRKYLNANFEEIK